MSGRQIHEIAQKDSQEVRLPDGWPGIIAWAATKFGVSAVFAAVLLWGISQVYRDQQALNERVLSAFQAQTEAMMSNRQATDKLTAAVDALTRRERP